MTKIGRIAGTHGLGGAVLLSHTIGRKNWLAEGNPIFIALHSGSHIPYFIEHARWLTDDEVLLELEEVDSMEEAKKLSGKEVFANDVIAAAVEEDSPVMWKNFSIVDKTHGSIGSIADIFQTGPQWMATLFIGEKEVLIPMVDDFIIEVNPRNKFIRMDLPAGLLDL